MDRGSRGTKDPRERGVRGYRRDGVASGRPEQHSEGSPDLVLLDIVLGNENEIDGVRLAKEIRSRLSVPIVFVTAYADAQTVSRAAEVEPAGFVVKPFQEAQLISTLKMVVRRPATGSEPATPDAQPRNGDDPRKSNYRGY